MRLIALSVLVVMSSSCESFARGPVSGRSDDLNITFQAEGGDQWCGSTVRITMSANDDSSFAKSTERFQQMIGRLRGAVTSKSECPKVEKIALEGRVADRVVYAAETSRLARWLLIEYDLITGRPKCFKSDMDRLQCDKYVEAFILAQSVMSQKGFGGVTFTQMLSIGTQDSDLEWKSGEGVGKLKIVDLEAMKAAGAPSNEIAKAIADGRKQICQNSGGRVVEEISDTHGRDLAREGLTCSQGAAKRVEHFIVSKQGSKAFVFTVGGINARLGNAKKFGDSLIAAFRPGV